MIERFLSSVSPADESGQTMAEYAVVLAVITIAVIVTLGLLSDAISAQLTSVIGISNPTFSRTPHHSGRAPSSRPLPKDRLRSRAVWTECIPDAGHRDARTIEIWTPPHISLADSPRRSTGSACSPGS